MEKERGREQWSEDRDEGALGALTVLLAFGVGLLAGATVMLLNTPETGASVRRRVKLGAETARQELDSMLEDTQHSLGGLRDTARETVKRTTSRLKEAAQATKDAVLDEGSSKPTAP